MVDTLNNAVKIKSELYSLINSVIELHSKFKKGMIKEGFFYKSLKNYINQFHKLNNICKEESINLQDLIIQMSFVENYNKAIQVINEVSSMRISNDPYKEQDQDRAKPSEKLKSSLLDLPKIASDITASFITLMDALKIDVVNNNDLINQLFNDIIRNLSQFSGLESVRKKVTSLFEQTSVDQRKMLGNSRYREQVVNQLYDIYNEFQKRLCFKV